MKFLFAILMFVTSVFLILLVLVQRGRGGGLAGAFGGMGGQSAFGTKAGDLFTRITMFVAGFWIVLCVAAIAVLNSQRESAFGSPSPDSAFSQPGLENTGGDDTGGEPSSGLSTTPGPAEGGEPPAGDADAGAASTRAAEGAATEGRE